MEFDLKDILEEFMTLTQENLLLKLQVKTLKKKIVEPEEKGVNDGTSNKGRKD